MYTDADLNLFDDFLLVPTDPNIIDNQVSEVHIYSFYGDYISGNHNAGYVKHDFNTNSLLVDVGTVFREAGIQKGSYLIVLNLFQDVWGSFGSEPCIVKEISPDRTEIHFQVNKSFLAQYQTFQEKVLELSNSDILNNLVVNFGFNNIQKIINIRFDPKDFYIKLYQPIEEEIVEKNEAWFQFEVIDPYIDTIVLTSQKSLGNVNYLKGPNFDIDTSQYTSNATVFKNWNELLATNLPTQQRIIENVLSGSGIKLNIDYTNFENFIFYSSAEERIKNYKYKVGLIEDYSSSIAVLLNSTASNTTFISSSITVNQNRIDEITSQFDQWERWLYYEPTSSIFSHDLTGSLYPQPKRIISGSWLNHSFSSSLVTNWYDEILVSASAYDALNQNRLWWSIPEHVIMEPGNSDFVKFVDMVGHHFDEIYSYVNALTQIHERDEHPQRGTPNELLWHIAKSFGWQLQNTHQVADLWKYQLGKNPSGSFDFTGSLFSLTGADQTHQIWRRTVNNLPYLLKTKGTTRSVKALMSIYGIPKTLISFKEYGGPSPIQDRPTLIEDRFIYKLRFTGSQYVELPRRTIPIASGSWLGTERVPDSIIFRFNTEYSSSISQSLWAIEDGNNRDRVLYNLELVHTSASFTGSYSGSYAYGQLRLTQSGSNAVSTSFLPMFDDDSWSVHLYASNSLHLEVKRANDSLFGRIAFSGSASVATSSLWNTGSLNYIVLGGTTCSNSNRFIGNIDGYKEYFELIQGSIFNDHVLNPSSYQANNETSSFDTLFRYFPLGLDQQRWDHTTYLNVSSSHPNRVASFDTTASFKNFTGNQTSQYNSANETHYIFAPSLGGNVLRSEKIRLEDISLARDLSPVARSEKGAFDRAGFDSNRLAIVFAPSDQINNDIFNHSGYVELDEWIADPQYEFDEGYSELNRFTRDYFKKYQSRYDINAMIRLLALYDYTFFEQVKQLIPGRADAILGILIEPDLLHRSKVQLTKRPQISNPQYDMNVPGLTPSQSGEYPVYDATASFRPIVQARYNYITGSIPNPVKVSGSSLFQTSSRCYPNGIIESVPHPYSGSQSTTQSYVDNYKTNCCYQKVIYHYSSSGQFLNKYERDWYTAVSMSYNWYYSRSLQCTSYQYSEECGAIENRLRFAGTKLEGPGININSNNTIDKGPVVSVWEVSPTRIEVGDSPNGGKLIIR